MSESGNDSIFESTIFVSTNDFTKEKKNAIYFPQIIVTRRKQFF